MALAPRCSELVTLNVGGRLFATTRSTLVKHPDSMLAAMFRGDMQASRLCDAQGHPFLDRDPTHFPTILAFLRDGRVPPLPAGLLELQQLKAEASYFAMTELVAAIEEAEAAAEAAEAAALLRQKQAEEAEDVSRAAKKAQLFLDEQRAEAVRAACEAVERAKAEHTAAEAPQERLRLVEQHAEELRRDVVDGAGADVVLRWQDALEQVQHAREEFEEEIQVEVAAARQLRQAHLARLLALGADIQAAQVQLAAIHPRLAALGGGGNDGEEEGAMLL